MIQPILSLKSGLYSCKRNKLNINTLNLLVMSKNVKTTGKVENVNVNVLENESTRLIKRKSVVQNDGPDFNNLQWLSENDPMNYIDPTDKNIVSSQYKEDREPKVQEGLKVIESLKVDDKEINPLLILLGKWWEHKTARKFIKEQLEQEADAKGFDSAHYLQNVLGAEIDKLAEIQNAINRLKYARTYFKPRNGIKTTGKMKPIRIDGEIYNVNVVEFNNLVAQYGDDKIGLKAAILEIAIKSNDILEL